MNTPKIPDLFQRTLQIVDNGRKLDMRAWIRDGTPEDPACGTTYCIAGALCVAAGHKEHITHRGSMVICDSQTGCMIEPDREAYRILKAHGVYTYIPPAENVRYPLGTTTNVFFAAKPVALAWLQERVKEEKEQNEPHTTNIS